MFQIVRVFRNKLFFDNFTKQARLKHEWILPEGYDTGINIYSRIANKKVPLVLLDKNLVKWYMCGPTVYDVAHIGHASCYVRFDIIRRILERVFDIKPVVALGMTDIDDKIIKRSIMLQTDFRSLAKKYELEFLNQLNELNVLPPSFILRVSDHIPEIIEFISKIVEQGKGYCAEDGSVYFKSHVFERYGKLNSLPSKGSSPLKKGQEHYLDFALWKGAKPNEPYWESPWGKGRPGWHIECSAMASKIFGSKLDMHSGGIDIVFPHHENEEAQSCAYHNCDQWVNYWMHSGLLEIKKEKMSKSLNNFISISDFLSIYSPDELRMYCFMSNYKNALHYSMEAMKLARELLQKISDFLQNTNSYIKGTLARGNISESVLLQDLEETKQKIKSDLRDDFNTSECLKSLMSLIKTTLKMMNEEESSSVSRSPGSVAAVSNFVSDTFSDFGFQLQAHRQSEQSDSQHKLDFILDALVNFRHHIRGEALLNTEKPMQQSILKACDTLRSELKTIGVEIRDDKSKSSWILKNV